MRDNFKTFLVLFALMLLPNMAWAEDYPIKVGGVQVTDANKDNITGTTISGYAVTYDNGTKTLTLNNATIDMSNTTDYPIESSLEELTIHLIGFNTIYVNGTANYFVNYTNAGAGTPQLNFTTDWSFEDGSYWLGNLTINNIADQNHIANGYTISNVWKSGTSEGWRIEQDPTVSTTFIISELKILGLAVGDTQATSENLGSFWQGSGYFNPNNNTLTLDGYVQENDHVQIESSLDNLTIEFKGTNSLGSNSGYFGFIKSTNTTATLTLKGLPGDDGSPSTLDLHANNSHAVVEGFASVVLDGTYLQYESPIGYNTVSKQYESDYGQLQALTITTQECYPLWIRDTHASYQATTTDAVVDGVTFSVSGTTNKLTLDNVNLNYKIVSDLDNLTVELIGANIIESPDTGSVFRSRNKDAVLTFTKSGATASLELSNADQINSPAIISGFSSFDCSAAGLYINTSAPTKYETKSVDTGETLKSLVSAIEDANNGYVCIHSATISSTQTYPLWVYNWQISADNMSNIIDYPYSSVSYDGSGTLTLMGSEFGDTGISNLIVIGDGISTLNVNIKGFNYLSSSANLFASTSACTVNLNTDEDVPGVIQYNKDPHVANNKVTLNYNNGLVKDESDDAYNYISVADGNTTQTTLFGINQVYSVSAGTTSSTADPDYDAYDGSWLFTNAQPMREGYTPLISSSEKTAAIRNSNVAGTFDGKFLTSLSMLFDWNEAANTAVNVVIESIDGSSQYTTATAMSTSSGVITINAGDAQIPLNDFRIKFSSSEEFSFILFGIKLNYLLDPGLEIYESETTATILDAKDITFGDSFTPSIKFTGVPVGDPTPTVTWSSSNTTIVTVNATTGEVTPQKTSTDAVIITATTTANDTYGSVQQSYTIAKVDKADAGLKFYKEEDGKVVQVTTASATYGTAFEAPSLDNPQNLSITYRSKVNNNIDGEDSEVATIDATTGVITINRPGEAYIFASTTGNGNYAAATVSYTLTVNKGSLANVTIAPIADQEYTGSAITPDLEVTTPDGTAIDVSTGDYEILYDNNISAGEATITVAAKNSNEYFYEGSSKQATFTITQLDISNATVTLDNTTLIYNGSVQTVNVTTVSVGVIEVPIDCYEVSGNTGTEIGDYKLTITAKTMDSSGNPIKNNFTGSAEKDWKIKYRTVTADELGLSDNQTYATYFNNTENLELPDGIVAYIITGVSGTTVTTKRISYIPKDVAVLVESGTSTEDAVDVATDNQLQGTAAAKDVSTITGGAVYVLYKSEFVKTTTGTIPANRCYLVVSGGAGARSLSISHGEGNGTGIKDVMLEEDGTEKWYDLQGRRINQPTKPGLYIINGKKTTIKKQ